MGKDFFPLPDCFFFTSFATQFLFLIPFRLKEVGFCLSFSFGERKVAQLQCPHRSRSRVLSLQPAGFLSSVVIFLICSWVFSLGSALGMLDLEVMGRKGKSAVLGLGPKLVVLEVAIYNKNSNVEPKIEVRVFLLKKEVAYKCLQAAHLKGDYNIPCPPGHVDLSCM